VDARTGAQRNLGKMKKIIKIFFIFSFLITSNIYAEENADFDSFCKIIDNSYFSEAWLLDVLKSKDRITVFKYTDIYHDTLFDFGEDSWSAKWYEVVKTDRIKVLEYEYFGVKEKKGIVFNMSMVIEKISFSKINETKYEGIFKENLDSNIDNEENSVMNWSNIRKMRKFKVRFVFDGDYLYIYDSQVDGSNEELFFTFVNINTDTYNELENLIRNNKCDLSKVTWPRHADGSCDYENGTTLVASSSSATNITVSKIMYVKENLKLRSAEVTSSNVLTVMSVGTKVKVIELGKEETIDNIKSNWVKVEIISGKDRNGNILKSGMTGWCYGGYLE